MRKSILFTTLLSFFLLVSFNHASAQSLGTTDASQDEPSRQDLEMTDYPSAPDANAVVLAKTTLMRYVIEKNDIKVRYDVKGRIKILKPEGTEHAILQINYTVNDDKQGNREIVDNIKGASYNLDNGAVKKTEINTSMISSRMATDPHQRVMTIIFPDVRQGTVIDYEYSIISDLYLEIRDWEAQCDIPVVYTRYELSIPEWFSFYMQTLGKEYNTNRIVQKQMTNRPTYTIMTAAQSFSCLGNNFEFEGHYLSPIKNESLVFNPHNTGQRVVIDITSLSLPGQLKKNYSMTWEDIDKSLLERNDFGKLLRSNPLKKEMKKAGIYQMTNVNEKIAATVKLLRQRVKWNGIYSLTGTPSKQVLKNGSGTNSDINFMLIAMLNDAGIKAYPIILATRDRDYIDMDNPNLRQISTTAVAIDNGCQYQCFDGSVENGAIDVLPDSFLVSKARIINKDVTDPWISLEDKGVAKSSYQLTGTISQDGILSATCVITHRGKAAEAMREALKNRINDQECPNEKFQSPDFYINEYIVEGLNDTEQPVTEIITFSHNTQCENGIINIHQLLWPIINPSPFESEKRVNPIEFPNKVDETASISISIPDGWTVDDVPAPMSLNTSDSTILLSITPSSTASTINVDTRLLINRLNFTKRDYSSIRTIVERINKHCSTPFVIKKQQ